MNGTTHNSRSIFLVEETDDMLDARVASGKAKSHGKSVSRTQRFPPQGMATSDCPTVCEQCTLRNGGHISVIFILHTAQDCEF